MKRRWALSSLLIVDCVGLLILAIMLVSAISKDSGKWYRLRVEMTTAFLVAAVLDVLTVLRIRWTPLMRGGVGFYIAATMLNIILSEFDGMTLAVCVEQAIVASACVWLGFRQR